MGQEPVRTAWWWEKLGLGFPVLADPAAHVQGLYGVARQLVVHDAWVNGPAAFVIDREGVVRQAHVGRGFNDRVSAAPLLADLSALGTPLRIARRVIGAAFPGNEEGTEKHLQGEQAVVQRPGQPLQSVRLPGNNRKRTSFSPSARKPAPFLRTREPSPDAGFLQRLLDRLLQQQRSLEHLSPALSGAPGRQENRAKR